MKNFAFYPVHLQMRFSTDWMQAGDEHLKPVPFWGDQDLRSHKFSLYTECKYGGPLAPETSCMKVRLRCFDNASPEKSCFVDGLVCFISLCLLVFVFLNATRRDRNCPTFASTEK